MFIGQTVLIKTGSDGNGKVRKRHAPTKDKISLIYADGSVQVMSGDVYQVAQTSSGLVATN
jgi:hypothetical protein